MKVLDDARWLAPPQRLAAALWISFLFAALATGAFFSAIDPLALRYCVDFPEVSRMGAYTIGFLLFWLLTSTCALVAVFFVYPANPAAPKDPPNP